MKRKKILTGIFIFFTILMFYGAFVTYTLSGAEKILPNYFVRYLESKNCEVINQLDLQAVAGIDTYYITNKETCPYSASYLIISDRNKKNEIFDEMELVVKDNPNMIYDDSLYYYGSNYVELYTSGDYYRTLVEYEDSILFIETDISLKDEVIAMKKDFGYYIENKNEIVWKFFFGMGMLFILIVFFINFKPNATNGSVAKVKLGILEMFQKL